MNYFRFNVNDNRLFMWLKPFDRNSAPYLLIEFWLKNIIIK